MKRFHLRNPYWWKKSLAGYNLNITWRLNNEEKINRTTCRSNIPIGGLP